MCTSYVAEIKSFMLTRITNPPFLLFTSFLYIHMFSFRIRKSRNTPFFSEILSKFQTQRNKKITSKLLFPSVNYSPIYELFNSINRKSRYVQPSIWKQFLFPTLCQILHSRVFLLLISYPRKRIFCKNFVRNGNNFEGEQKTNKEGEGRAHVRFLDTYKWVKIVLPFSKSRTSFFPLYRQDPKASESLHEIHPSSPDSTSSNPPSPPPNRASPLVK